MPSDFLIWWWVALEASACTIGVDPFAVGSSETFFWGVFGGVVVEVPVEGVVGSDKTGRWSPRDSTEKVSAQLFYVGDAATRMADQRERPEMRGRFGPALLVLWDYGPGCGPLPHRGREPWGVVGERVYGRGFLRHPDDWAYGFPTLDIYYSGQTLAPWSATVRGRKQGETDMMSRSDGLPLDPSQMFEMLRDMPGPCEWERRPLEARRKRDAAQHRWRHMLEDRTAGHILGPGWVAKCIN